MKRYLGILILTIVFMNSCDTIAYPKLVNDFDSEVTIYIKYSDGNEVTGSLPAKTRLVSRKAQIGRAHV